MNKIKKLSDEEKIDIHNEIIDIIASKVTDITDLKEIMSNLFINIVNSSSDLRSDSERIIGAYQMLSCITEAVLIGYLDVFHKEERINPDNTIN